MQLDFKPRLSDVNDVERLVKKAGVFSGDEIKTAGELVDDALKNKDDYQFVFMRTDDDQLAGYTCYGIIPLTEKSYDLYWIAVDPKFQHQGLAKTLLNETGQSIVRQGGAHLYAETSSLPQYESAHRFYKKTGFILHSVFKDFYKDGDDKWVFYRAL